MLKIIADSCRIFHLWEHKDGDGAAKSSACHSESESEPEASRTIPIQHPRMRLSSLHPSFSLTLKLAPHHRKTITKLSCH